MGKKFHFYRKEENYSKERKYKIIEEYMFMDALNNAFFSKISLLKDSSLLHWSTSINCYKLRYPCLHFDVLYHISISAFISKVLFYLLLIFKPLTSRCLYIDYPFQQALPSFLRGYNPWVWSSLKCCIQTSAIDP